MGLRGILEAIASGAEVPVFAVAGEGARDLVQDLRLLPEVDVAESPRSASLLLLAGDLPSGLLDPIRAAHDAMPAPRATVWWPLTDEGSEPPAVVPGAMVLGTREPVGEALVRIHRELLRGDRPSEPPLLPNDDPAPWRGVGPYGQGGKGMTGGVPYGRPLAERADDRDGLSLDQLPARVGPLFGPFPPGLCLDVKLQGDVIQEASVESNPFALEGGGPRSSGSPAWLRPFELALAEPVPVAALEMWRARSHLRWLSGFLRLHGLAALGLRALRLAATAAPGDAEAVRTLGKRLTRTQVLGWATRGVGKLSPEALDGLGAGPSARASGLTEDARAQEPEYRAIGFEPVVHEAGDVAARCRQRVTEAAQALDLVARAGDRRAWGKGVVESPRGRLELGSSPSLRLLEILPGLLAGQEWGDAVATVQSLDLDLEEAAILQPTPEAA